MLHWVNLWVMWLEKNDWLIIKIIIGSSVVTTQAYSFIIDNRLCYLMWNYSLNFTVFFHCIHVVNEVFLTINSGFAALIPAAPLLHCSHYQTREGVAVYYLGLWLTGASVFTIHVKVADVWPLSLAMWESVWQLLKKASLLLRQRSLRCHLQRPPNTHRDKHTHTEITEA